MARSQTISLLTNDYISGEAFDISDVSPATLADVLLRFDGRAIDNVLITVNPGEDDVDISLADGRNGWCSVFFADAHQSWYLCATDPPPHSARRFVMSVAGQTETDQWGHWVVPTTSAIRSLWYFLLTGDRDPGLTWERFDPATFIPSGPTDPWPDVPPRLIPTLEPLAAENPSGTPSAGFRRR